VKNRKIVYCGLVAAVYATLTVALAPISFGAVQVRVAEALCLLPFWWPETVWGLLVGCLISNAVGMSLGVSTVLDLIVGPIMTLAAGWLTSKCHNKFLAPIPPIILNAVGIGAVIAWTGVPSEMFWWMLAWTASTVGLGELIACGGVGLALLAVLKKAEKYFPQTKRK